MAPKVDHIIIGLPYSDLQKFPSWLTDNFTIAPGGRHADGKTENKLVVFKDGSYLELIAFINDDPEKKKGHWWGELGSGIIDFAFTSESPEDVHEVNKRIDDAKTGLNGARYQEPREGGRIKPDGTEIKWKVTFPENVRRGEAPFWCHDLTPRELRVTKDEKLTTHPSGALGVGVLDLQVPDSRLSPFKKFYTALVGEDNEVASGSATWSVEAVNKLPGVRAPQLAITSDTERQHTSLTKLALLTDTSGSGTSRSPLVGKLGDAEVHFDFVHGKQ
ncbi:Hypothetical protein D9617_3g021550 [Elsinoe fawcettii]|nr:Hypothetical protein D9617_3g021550 [Elsinoe fawcettii]